MRLLLFILLSFTFLTANQYDLTQEEKEWIKNNEVVIGVEQWYPITFTNNNDQLEGLIGDIFKEVANKYNIRYKVTTDKWHIILKNLKENKIHLIPAAFYTKERSRYALYSSVVHQSKEYIYVKDNNDSINNLSSLNKKKLAIIKNYGTIPKIKKKFPHINIIESNDLQHAINLVIEGKVDALYDSQIVIEQYLINNLITGLKPIKQNIFPASNLHVIIHKSYPILHSILEKGLKSISKKRRTSIIKKWLYEKINKTQSILTNDEINYLNKRTDFKICIDPDWMPFEKIKKGKHIGISSSFMQYFEKKLNIPFNLVPTNSWTQTLQYIKEKKCDMLPLAMKTEERKKYLNFTKDYIQVPLLLITKESIPFITTIEELNGKKIGIPSNYAFNEIIRQKYPKVKVIDVKNLHEGLEKIERDELWGQISTNITTAYEFERHFHKSLKISGHFDKSLDLSIAVQKEDTLLLNILNKLLINTPEEVKHQILNKWVTHINYDTHIDYTLIFRIVIAAIIIFLFFLYNHLLLKKNHKELKQAKENIQTHNTLLEKKVRNRTQALEILNENLDKEVKDEIKKRQEKEQLLIEKSRLADMGSMLSMIAHQWRQPLSALGNIVQNIHLSNSVGKLDQDYLDKQLRLSNNLTGKMSETLNDFKYFFKPNKEKYHFSVHESIVQAMYLLSDTLKDQKIIIKNLSKGDSIIHGFGNEFSQVLLNMINNSKDALIEHDIQNPTIIIKTDICPEYLKLKISDNAGGIEEENLSKIFDPYFTTKDEHNGTGLGLYMCKMIVEDSMKGKIEVQNIEDGVEFIITVPI